MGHSLANDVTNNVYIHMSVEKLSSYIEKIEYNFFIDLLCMVRM